MRHEENINKKTAMNLRNIIANIANKKENLTESEYNLLQLFNHITSEITNKPETIYIYRETIRIAPPYICFVFLDTDFKPIATNICLNQSYLNIPFHHIKLIQREPHILHEGSLFPNAQREKPILRSFMLDISTSIIDKAIPTAEQPVSLASNPNFAQREKPAFWSFTLDTPTCVMDKAIPTAEQTVSLASTQDPNAQREKPAPRSFTLDTPTCVIDKAIPTVEQTVYLASTLDPNAQREKPVYRSFMLDSPVSIIDKAIPAAEQCISSDASRNFRMQDKGVLTNAYILENQFGQCINKIMGEAQKCDSYNFSLLITRPRCYDHHIFRHETRCKIARFHRYRRSNHIAYLKTMPAT